MFGYYCSLTLAFRTEFVSVADSDNAFESFLVGSKGDLTPSEIAKIRDTVGIVGMNGS